MAGQVKLSGTQVPSLPKSPHPPSSSFPPQSASVSEGAPLQQQQLVSMGVGIHALNQPIVLVSPLKVPISQLPHAVQHHLSSWGLTRGSAKTGYIGTLEEKLGRRREWRNLGLCQVVDNVAVVKWGVIC